MAEKWYLRDLTGATCGAGDNEELRLLNGISPASKVLSNTPNGDTWNRIETARSIQSGDWVADLEVTVSSGAGGPNKITVLIRRMNSSCVAQETIMNLESGTLPKGAHTNVVLTESGHAQVDFAADDRLIMEIWQSSGTRDITIFYNDTPTGEDSFMTNPNVVIVSARRVMTIS